MCALRASRRLSPDGRFVGAWQRYVATSAIESVERGAMRALGSQEAHSGWRIAHPCLRGVRRLAGEGARARSLTGQNGATAGFAGRWPVVRRSGAIGEDHCTGPKGLLDLDAQTTGTREPPVVSLRDSTVLPLSYLSCWTPGRRPTARFTGGVTDADPTVVGP